MYLTYLLQLILAGLFVSVHKIIAIPANKFETDRLELNFLEGQFVYLI